MNQGVQSSYYNNKNIEKFNERMRQARIVVYLLIQEKEIKDNAHKRGEIFSPERVSEKTRFENKVTNNITTNNSNNFITKQSHSKERSKIKSLSPQKDSNKHQGPVAKVLTKDAEEQMREYLMQNDPKKSELA